MRPRPGFTVLAPVAVEGILSEPAISFPCARLPLPLITAAEAPPDEPEWVAINDRLTRAGG